MRGMCSGFEAKVSICGALAVVWCEVGGKGGVLGLVKQAFSSKVRVLP